MFCLLEPGAGSGCPGARSQVCRRTWTDGAGVCVKYVLTGLMSRYWRTRCLLTSTSRFLRCFLRSSHWRTNCARSSPRTREVTPCYERWCVCGNMCICVMTCTVISGLLSAPECKPHPLNFWQIFILNINKLHMSISRRCLSAPEYKPHPLNSRCSF